MFGPGVAILAPLDGGAAAEAAVPALMALARAARTPVQLFAAYQPGPPARATVRRLVDYLERTATRLRAQGVPVASVVKEGCPSDRLVERAARRDIALVLLPYDQQDGEAARQLAGRLLAETRRPVLFVPSSDGVAPATVVRRVLVVLTGDERHDRHTLDHAHDLAERIGAALSIALDGLDEVDGGFDVTVVGAGHDAGPILVDAGRAVLMVAPVCPIAGMCTAGPAAIPA